MLKKLLIALGAREDDVYPYTHRLRCRGHEKQRPVGSLDAERALRPWTARPTLVVDKHVLYRLEPDEGAVGALLSLVGVVVEAALYAVEHEPAPFPLSDGDAGAQLGQVAVAGARRELYELTLVQPVTGCLDETPQVQVTVEYRKVARQRARARLRNTSDIQSVR